MKAQLCNWNVGMMRLPSTLKILGMDWTISSPNVELGHRSRYGEMIEGNQEIHIDDGQGIQHQQATLLHEVIHAISALSCDPDLTEGQTKTLGVVLAQVLRENPGLVEFVVGVEHG